MSKIAIATSCSTVWTNAPTIISLAAAARPPAGCAARSARPWRCIRSRWSPAPPGWYGRRSALHWSICTRSLRGSCSGDRNSRSCSSTCRCISRSRIGANCGSCGSRIDDVDLGIAPIRRRRRGVAAPAAAWPRCRDRTEHLARRSRLAGVGAGRLDGPKVGWASSDAAPSGSDQREREGKSSDSEVINGFPVRARQGPDRPSPTKNPATPASAGFRAGY